MISGLGSKGISSVITVALIVLGTIIGVALLWAFVNKSVERGGDTVDTDCLTLNLDLIDCKAYGSCNYYSGLGGYSANILINRKAGSGNLTGLRFVFEDQYGFKKTYDRDLNPPSLNELEGVQFGDGYAIPIPGQPNLVRVVPLIGAKKDVCPITSNSKTCQIVQLPPPLGNSPNNPIPRSYCCQQSVNYSECYNGLDPEYPINMSGQLTNGIIPPGNRTLCCR